MTGQTTTRSGLARYAAFSGRTSRSRYWQGVLAATVAVAVLGALLVKAASAGFGLGVALVLLGLVGLAPPLLAGQVRRLHDVGWSGWWAALALVPFVGACVLVVVLAAEGTCRPNVYGAPVDAPPAMAPPTGLEAPPPAAPGRRGPAAVAYILSIAGGVVLLGLLLLNRGEYFAVPGSSSDWLDSVTRWFLDVTYPMAGVMAVIAGSLGLAARRGARQWLLLASAIIPSQAVLVQIESRVRYGSFFCASSDVCSSNNNPVLYLEGITYLISDALIPAVLICAAIAALSSCTQPATEVPLLQDHGGSTVGFL